MASEPLIFAHIGDTHIHTDPNYTGETAPNSAEAGITVLIQQIQNLPMKLDFVLHVGDVAFDPVPEVYEKIQVLMQQIPYPIYYAGGNHDHHPTLQRVLMNRDDSEITPQLNYAVDVKGMQLAVIDSNGNATPPTGNLTEEQLTFLDEICSVPDDRPLILAVHHSVLPVGVPWLDEWMSIDNGEAFHQIALKAKHRLRGVFHGHIHQNSDVIRDGINYSACASSWYQLNSYPGMTQTTPDIQSQAGFSIVTITENQTYIRRHLFSIK
jgi:Icc protein